MFANQLTAAPDTRRIQASLPLAAFVLAALAVALPIMAHVHLPMVDLPNHIARLHIAAGQAGPLDAYYSYKFSFAPNFAVDMIWLLLGHPGSPERFSQIVLAAYAVGLVGATFVLSRVLHGRWMAWPSVAAIAVFSGPFFWGFQNFVVTAPFAILALALWLATEQRSLAVRCTLFVPIALLLYLMHFFAFCFLAIAVFGREVQLMLEAGRAWKRSFFRSVVLILPFAGPVLWLVASVLGGPESPAGSHTDFGTLARRVWMVLLPLGAPNAEEHPAVNWTGVACYLALAGSFMTLLRSRGARLQIVPMMKGPLIALVVAMFAAPTWLNGVAFVDLRLPFLVIATLVAATSWRQIDHRSVVAVAMLFAVLILVRGIAIERFAYRHTTEIADLSNLLESLPEGSRVLPIRATAKTRDLRLSHVQAYAVFLRNSFIPTLFQGVHDLVVRPEWRDATHPALFAVDQAFLDPEVARREAGYVTFLTNWPQKFDHVLLLDQTDAPPQSPVPLAWVATSGRFSLFKIMPAQ